MPTVSHDEVMVEIYREDPAYVEAMLNDLFADETATSGEVLIALRQMAKAFGGMRRVAEKSKLNVTQLYRTLSVEGNPSLSSLTAILRVMGMRLAVQRIEVDDAMSQLPKPVTRVRKKTVRGRSRTTLKTKAA